MMDAIADALQWAEHVFGGAELGDHRRTRRLVHSAAKIAAHPEKPFPQVLDWNELRGFYRLCNERRVTWEAAMTPHLEADPCRDA
ncbi:MAG: transposase [Pirellulales bacterium]|nr:transposase [Pirellulales bacterium]